MELPITRKFINLFGNISFLPCLWINTDCIQGVVWQTRPSYLYRQKGGCALGASVATQCDAPSQWRDAMTHTPAYHLCDPDCHHTCSSQYLPSVKGRENGVHKLWMTCTTSIFILKPKLIYSTVVTIWSGTVKVSKSSPTQACEISAVVRVLQQSWVYLADIQESIKFGGHRN